MAGAEVASAGYLYVADIDSMETTGASVSLPIHAETVGTLGDHSLFEMSMSNESVALGDIIEIGVTTDPNLNGDSAPPLVRFLLD